MRSATAFILGTLAAAASAAEPAPLELVQTILLPGVQGRFDHFALDVKGRRLFVAALGNDTLEAIDLATGKRLGSVAGMSEPTGILYLVEADQIVAANGGDGTLKFLDGAELRVVRTLTAFADADNLRRDPKTARIYLGYADGALGILDSSPGGERTEVPLPRHPESFQLEEAGSRVFVNVPEARQIAVVDREKRSVVGTWPLEDLRANFPMALDEAGHRLFVGCREPARLLVLDTATGAPVAQIAIAGDVDDLFFDAARQRLYLSGGEGFVDVVTRPDPDHYVRSARVPTARGARTSLFSPELSQLYLAVPAHGAQPAQIRVFRVLP